MKLIHEEKAWEDDHGDWLVHEGETMEQAKARVDDKERQRLKQQEEENIDAEIEEEKQEKAKWIAEDQARFAERDDKRQRHRN